MTDDAMVTPGRYQVICVGKSDAVLLDTATGISWSLARDIDTLQLGWRLLEESWPPGELARERPSQRPSSRARTLVSFWHPRAKPDAKADV